MIVSIPVSEKPGFEKACAIAELKVQFFSQENNDQLLTMETEEISPELVYHLTRMAETQNEILRFLNA